MRVPSKLDTVTILIKIDSDDKDQIELIANGLVSKVNYEFGIMGYSVNSAFVIGSENGFKGQFYIKVKPIDDYGDTQIVVIDNEKAQKHDEPTLETLTKSLIKGVQNRDGLNFAFVRRSDIPGNEFLENYIVKENENIYIIKNNEIKL